ncbi:MAG: PAS domain-containing protein [Deltaproteobacteria bacterium]|nr:PAS domain-containing protein [Deltaproteobacteria bacterium]
MIVITPTTWVLLLACAALVAVSLQLRYRARQERSQMARHLHEREERLALVLEAAEMGWWEHDLRSGAIERDRRHDQIYGYGSGLGEFTIEAFLRHALPADHDRISAAICAAAETGRFSLEWRIRRKDGEIRWVEGHGKLERDGAGEPARFVGAIRDVTCRKVMEEALRESEERFRQLAFAAPVGIFRTDLSGGCVYTNPRWHRLAGLSFEQSLGDGWASAVHPEDRERVLTEWRNATHRGQEFDLEFRVRTPAGAVRWIQAHAGAIRSERGEPLGYVGTNDDVTEKKAIEQLRRDVVSMLSHDIKNPLMAIRGYAEILRENLHDSCDAEASIDAIESAAEQAMSLALNFLEADRIESGLLELRRARASLNEIVERVIGQQAARARFKGVQLRADVDAALPPFELDRSLIERVLANLLSNAIKFSPAGGAVDVATRRDGDRATVSVRDHGPGIDADNVSRLFQRYSRSGRSDSTGLGLFIVRTLVEAHGGSVGVESERGAGAVFAFSLPLGAAAAGEPCERAAPRAWARTRERIAAAPV